MRNEVTRANAVREQEVIQKILLFQLCCVKKCKTKKERQTTKQKHSRTIPDVQFKEFSLNKQKTKPRTDY